MRFVLLRAISEEAKTCLRIFFVKCIIKQLLDSVFCDIQTGATIGDGDRKSWDLRAPMIWDNFSIFRTNCAILTSYIRADSRAFRGLSRGCCHDARSNSDSCEILLRISHSEGKE